MVEVAGIANVVFDIGKVLLHWDPEIPYHRLIPDQARRRWFLNNVCSQAWNLRQDRGRDWRQAEDELIDRFPAHEQNIRAYRRHWIEMVPHMIADNVALMAELISEDFHVTLLTNFNQDTFAEAAQKYPFLNTVAGATVSGHIGLLKPEPEIFRHHSKSFGLKPAETVFIDDSRANIAAAKDHGWRAIHYHRQLDLGAAVRQLLRE